MNWTKSELEEFKLFYDNNGFLLTPVLEKSECDYLLSVLEKHADINYSAQMNLDRKDPRIKPFMHHPKVIELVKELFDNAVVGTLISQILYKKAGTPYANQAWQPHQDNSYPQAPYGAMLTVNIFLQDADLENGCMYLYPGSHREPLLDFEPTQSYKERPGTNPGNRVQIPSQYSRLDLTAKKGDALFLHGNMIHGSYPNISADRSRPLFSATYIKKDASYLKGKNANREWEEIG